ncbi:MAG: hypothetical protein ABR955_04340 [Verrucomicrobiota bacterium]|jgi:hypothetical protein
MTFKGVFPPGIAEGVIGLLQIVVLVIRTTASVASHSEGFRMFSNSFFRGP